VVYRGLNKKGKHELSRKAVLEARREARRGGGGRDNRREENKPPTPAPEMSKEEVDVIAQAIESVQ